jgi:hypothetical protein
MRCFGSKLKAFKAEKPPFCVNNIFSSAIQIIGKKWRNNWHYLEFKYLPLKVETTADIGG